MTKRDVKRIKDIVTVGGIAVASIVILIGFQNCSSEHSGGSASGPSQAELLANFENAAKATMAEKCSSCHLPDTLENTDLTNILDTSFLLDEAYVVPGEPQNSDLYLIPLDGIAPHTRNMLNALELETIRDWILSMADPTGTGGIILPNDPGGGGGANAPTFSFINSTIIQDRCVQCHNANRADGGRRLDTYAFVREIVDVDRPNASILYNEVRNDNMPRGSAPLTAAQKGFILQWIEAGAPNN